jgi:hypothetical protein
VRAANEVHKDVERVNTTLEIESELNADCKKPRKERESGSEASRSVEHILQDHLSVLQAVARSRSALSVVAQSKYARSGAWQARSSSPPRSSYGA